MLGNDSYGGVPAEAMTDGPVQSEMRGQVGIGTLIIFIGLVLVAAVAAGVLVDTAGLLEAQATDTAADAEGEVIDRIEVVSVTGYVYNNGSPGGSCDGEPNKIRTADFVVKKTAGGGLIDLRDLRVYYQGPYAAHPITYADLTEVAGESGPYLLSETGDRSQFSIRFADFAGENGHFESDGTYDGILGLDAGMAVSLRFDVPGGGTSLYQFSVPTHLPCGYLAI